MVIVGFSGALNSQYYIDKYKIRFVGHDSSVSILVDGKLVFAAEEERYNLDKHTAAIPHNALSDGLAFCNLKWEDIDCFVFPWSSKKLELLLTGFNHLIRTPIKYLPKTAYAGISVLNDAMSSKKAVKEMERLFNKKTNAKIATVDHHIAHVASSFLSSTFKEAAFLSIDGSGGFLSAMSGEWKNGTIKQFSVVKSPNSIGILYGIFTEFLGYRCGYDEYKVMGMAAYGNPNEYLDKVQSLLIDTDDGFSTKYTESILNLPYCIKKLEQHFGIQQRKPTEKLTPIHFNLAASVQSALEAQLLKMVIRLREKTSCKSVCLSGGVFQNSVANGRILDSKLFEKVFIPPVPGDNGISLGAALYYSSQINQEKIDIKPMDLGFSGTEYTGASYLNELKKFEDQIIFNKSDDIVEEAANLLASNKVVAWFQGRMEYGARALGNRSILASPINQEMKDTLNISIKNREKYRPFAASIPKECASEYFDISQESPYMQFVVKIKGGKAQDLRAINHFETCRIQTVCPETNPIFHCLLNKFGQKSGHPVLLNTSFNGKDQPIVCNPEQAIQTFMNLGLDALILGDYLITKSTTHSKT